MNKLDKDTEVNNELPAIEVIQTTPDVVQPELVVEKKRYAQFNHTVEGFQILTDDRLTEDDLVKLMSSKGDTKHTAVINMRIIDGKWEHKVFKARKDWVIANRDEKEYYYDLAWHKKNSIPKDVICSVRQ